MAGKPVAEIAESVRGKPEGDVSRFLTTAFSSLSADKGELDWRARLVTELRVRGVWPSVPKKGG